MTTWTKCYRCKEPFVLHPETEATLRRSGATFHCPWGHAQHFTEKESEADTLRRERDRLKQRAAQLEDATRAAQERELAAERRASAARGQVTRLKNRAAAGVCPCCNRTFVNLQRHMASKHVGFATSDDVLAGETIQ